jgi:hypothetical protein
VPLIYQLFPYLAKFDWRIFLLYFWRALKVPPNDFSVIHHLIIMSISFSKGFKIPEVPLIDFNIITQDYP